MTLPARHSVKAEQLLIKSDFKLDKSHPLIGDLNRLRSEVAEKLALPLKREQVVVYLFRDEITYRQYIEATFPRLPPRRAYFVGTPDELAVFTFWGERSQEDLRHEFTHGLLHSCHAAVPLWLDEGLAEYFEVDAAPAGRVNSDYAQRLENAAHNGWKPDIQRLESLAEFSQMQRIDYQEAWAWIHFLLHKSPQSKQLLLDYLRDLRAEREPVALSARLQQHVPDFRRQFDDYLRSLGRMGSTVGAR